MWRRILSILLLLYAAEAAADEHVILVMGDSLSAAYGLETSQGWVALLEQRLRERGYDYTVVNASMSGETTAGGLTRLPKLLDDRKPEIVVLELGANDGLRGTPVRVMQGNLKEMIRLSRGVQAKILLVGIRLPPNYGRQYGDAFRGVYPALAKQYGLPLVPFLLEGVAQDRGEMQEDGLHPVAAAEPMVLDNVWSKIIPLLMQPSSK